MADCIASLIKHGSSAAALSPVRADVQSLVARVVRMALLLRVAPIHNPGAEIRMHSARVAEAKHAIPNTGILRQPDRLQIARVHAKDRHVSFRIHRKDACDLEDVILPSDGHQISRAWLHVARGIQDMPSGHDGVVRDGIAARYISVPTGALRALEKPANSDVCRSGQGCDLAAAEALS